MRLADWSCHIIIGCDWLLVWLSTIVIATFIPIIKPLSTWWIYNGYNCLYLWFIIIYKYNGTQQLLIMMNYCLLIPYSPLSACNHQVLSIPFYCELSSATYCSSSTTDSIIIAANAHYELLLIINLPWRAIINHQSAINQPLRNNWYLINHWLTIVNH